MPKLVRNELGLNAGQPLQASVRDGRLEIEPTTLMPIVEVDGVSVITPRDPVEPTTREDVRHVIESVRR